MSRIYYTPDPERVEKQAIELLEKLYQIRETFMGMNITSPLTIIIPNAKDGRRLACVLSYSPESLYIEYEKPVEHPDGSVWMEIKFGEVYLRWPASMRASPTPSTQ